MDEDNIVAALRRGEDGWEYAAADEIEALRAENARLREALDKAAVFLAIAASQTGSEPLAKAAKNAARAAMGESDE